MPKKGRKPSKPRKPKKARGEPREAFPREDVLDAAEELLVSSTTARKAARELAKLKQLSTRHASRYVEFALERFKLEADSDPAKRAERRALLDAKIDRVYELCVTRGFVFTKKDGTVVRKIEVDSRGALGALAMKAALHNLLAPDAVDDPRDTETSEEALLALAAKHFGVIIDTQGETVQAPALPAEGEATEGP